MYKKEVMFFLIGVLSTVHQMNSTESAYQPLSRDYLNELQNSITQYIGHRREYTSEPLEYGEYRNKILNDFLYLESKKPLSTAEWINYTFEKYLIAIMTIQDVGTDTGLLQDAYTIDDAVEMIDQLIRDFFAHPEHFVPNAGTFFLTNCKKMLKSALQRSNYYKTLYVLACLYAQEGGEDNIHQSIKWLKKIIRREERDYALDQQKTQAAGGIRYSRVYAVDEALANQARTLLARLLVKEQYQDHKKIKHLLQKVAQSDYAYPQDKKYAEETLPHIT